MQVQRANVEMLQAEYESLLHGIAHTGPCQTDFDWETVVRRLEQDAEWTSCGAQHVVWLVRQYGAFVLRNALAVALALDVEDGETGL